MTAQTRLAMDNAGKVFVCAVGVAVGVLAGFLLPWLAGFAADHPIPFGGVVEFFASFDNPIVVAGRPLIGAAIGAALAAVVLARSPELTITDEYIRIRIGDDVRRVPRASVAGVYRQGGSLIIESAEGRKLYDGDVEGSRARVRDAFVEHGYPWEHEDADESRREP